MLVNKGIVGYANLLRYVLIALTFLWCSIAAQSLRDSAITLFLSGNYSEARTLLQRAYQQFPHDNCVAYYYARTLIDASKAITIYERVAADTAADDSIRLQACEMLIQSAKASKQIQKIQNYQKLCVNINTKNKSVKPVTALEQKPIHGTDKHLSSSKDSLKGYIIQVGAFGSYNNAIKQKRQLEKLHPNVKIVSFRSSNGNTLYRVIVGCFATREEAETFGQTVLRAQGFDYRVVDSEVKK